MRALMRDRQAATVRNRALRQCSAILLSAFVLLVSPTAHGQYRCVQPGGTVSYQQTPCAADAKGKRIELSPSATSTPGGKEDRTDWGAVIKGRTEAAGEAASAESKSRICPTPQQIKSMEYEASKIGNRNNSGMQSDLANARACR